MARSTRGVWPLAKHRHPLLPLGRGRGVGPSPRRAPQTGGRRRRSRLEPPSHRRWDLAKGAPTCGGSAKRGSSHDTAAPPEKDPQKTKEALGRSRGGFSTKIHLRAEGNGKPITFLMAPPLSATSRASSRLLWSRAHSKGSSEEVSADTPREGPVGDKGYSSNRSRSYLQKRGIGAVIARKDNEPRAGTFDKEAYRQRNLVERLINRLKQFWRVATRYEKRAVNYRAMLTIAAIVLWT